ncbi:MAG TPA: flagellar biosynthesis protein FlhA [Candidatus Acidoferrales bacterium]|nr:flagellar biosynthesis protein FlhA [Candidatus Acidoferrales bacterium]
MNPKAATYGFAALVLSIVGILIIPLPPVVLDTLLAFNMLGSGVVLLVSMTIAEPLEFAAFAPALLIATLFRLSLDVSVMRLVLTQGHLEGGVGSIIPAFGAFVVRGNLVVGILVVAILITIQFIVIASGAQRVAEVAARFTLDAMPGKQMAIDADVHAGVLDAEGARRKRSIVQKEADFYGAMDGAGKFVKGDAMAALIIAMINIIGGIVVGVGYHAMSPLEALNTYAILSIGNALVTALPAFLLSISMGMMVTRVASSGSLGFDLATQLLERPDVLGTAGVFAVALALVPALPHVLFLILACALFGAAAYARERRLERTRGEQQSQAQARRAAIRRPEMALALVGVDALSIDIGVDLGGLLTAPHSEALLDRIGEVRRALAAEIGIVLPGVRLRDDVAREPNTYAIRVRDTLAGEGRLRMDAMLAVADEAVLSTVPGERTVEPVYGMPACWISPDQRDRAVSAGALVFDPISIIGSHLAEAARRHARELLGRQELQTLLEHLRATVPTLVKEIGTDALPLATVHRVFETLLEERIWPRDIVATLEALVDAAPTTRDPRDLVVAVRRRIVPTLLQRRNLPYLEPLIVAPEFETELQAWLADGTLAPQPQTALHVRLVTDEYVARVRGDRSALICSSPLRPALSEFIRRFGARLEVYAYGELPPGLELRPAMVLNRPEGAAIPA